MNDAFVDQYNEEVSESSIIDIDNHKQDLPSKQLPKAQSPPKERFSAGSEIPLYTFNPGSVIKETSTSEVKYMPLGFSSSEAVFGAGKEFGYGRIKDPYVAKIGDTLMQRQQDVTTLTALGDLNECRRTDEYKGFAQEFEKEFTSDEKEMEQVSGDLVTRTKKLEGFRRELESADLDMILFRNRLLREIDDVQNDLKEAYNNILVLMEDRSNIKDQFCLFKMKIKKLKGFIKTFQDDIQA
jgi:hypothetical protein